MRLYPAIFHDDFNDGALNGWTPNGGAWSNPGGALRGEYAAGNAWNMRTETGGNLVYEGVLTLLSGNAVGLTFRSTPGGAASYDVILDAADGVFKISKRPPYQALAAFPMTVQYNHPYRVKVVATGALIEAYLDGIKRLTVTDSTYTGGRLGVMLFQSVAQYDDLIAWMLP
jgi:pectate lyase